MAELILHPNSPQPVIFECPGCGRECLLTPVFGTEGASRGVRLGNGVQHSLPLCSTYRTMKRMDFLMLATSEVPIIRDDVHVSVKLPELPPMIFADLKDSTDKAAAELERMQAQNQRDVEVFKAEAFELARVRDRLVREELLERARRRAAQLGAALALLALGMCVWTRSYWWCVALLGDVAGVVFFMRQTKRLAARASSSLGTAGPSPKA